MSNSLLNGMAVGYSSGNPMNILQEVSILKPTIFGSFPAFYNQVYKMSLAKKKIDDDTAKMLSSE